MPSALVATAGASNANAYCTHAEANAYHDDRPHRDDWRTADADARGRAILAATRWIDEKLDWSESGAFPTDPENQALLFPMNGLVDRLGQSIDKDSIPQFVKDACAEWALAAMREDLEGRTPESTRLQFGTMSAEKRDAKKPSESRRGVPDSVLSIVAYWGGRPKYGWAAAVR